MAYKNRKTAYKKKTVAKRKVYAPKKTAPLRKLVKAEIHRQIEDKTQSVGVLNMNLVPSNADAFLDGSTVISFSPGTTATSALISQGVGQGQRIGNKITVRKAKFKFALTPLGYDATTNPNPRPFYVKAWFYYDKIAPNAVNAPLSNFVQNGDIASGLGNTPLDLLAAVNADRYRLLGSQTFKVGFAESAGTGVVAAWQNHANNDFKMSYVRTIDVKKWLPKLMTFNDTILAATSRGLLCQFQCISATGNSYNAVEIPAKLTWRYDLTYEDA